jgi:hypothetical protein
MENGDSLSPSEFTFNWAENGLPLIQGAIILPMPGSDSLYYVFHTTPEYPVWPAISVHTSNLLYSIVDMSKNNGMGSVIEKNVIIVADILAWGAINAAKHGNGRDWWVIIKEYESSSYYRVLLSPDGVHNIGRQTVGDAIPSGLNHSVFSPDGQKYAFQSLYHILEGNYLAIYDFDRCTGSFSNARIEHYIDSAWTGGVAVSPSSQYLYVSSYDYIYKYNLWADDILSTKDTVAVYDGYEEPVSSFLSLPTRFFMPQLAPDGKIYICNPNNTKSLHVINQPDMDGTACDITQHSFMLPRRNQFSIPVFPNYRLGALAGSGCDTLTVTQALEARDAVEVEIYPNPASERLSVTISSPTGGPLELVVYNLSGSRVAGRALSGAGVHVISTAHLPSGLYWCSVLHNGIPVYSQRLAIIH